MRDGYSEPRGHTTSLDHLPCPLITSLPREEAPRNGAWNRYKLGKSLGQMLGSDICRSYELQIPNIKSLLVLERCST